MKLLTIIALQVALSGVSAAPAPNDCLVKQRSKLESCSGFSVDQDANEMAFLHAQCHGYDQNAGKWNKVDTGLDLNKCMANVNNQLETRENGQFASKCKKMNVEVDTTSGAVIFTARCDGWQHYGASDSSIDLGHVITVDNGELVCFGMREATCPTCWQPE
ncbi:hypothetical protein F4782DRAFT_509953 [Xylaria castorea]|nr:hypothetical protein F4782DRAFT_509953 [Xylaria castorea]